MDRSNTRKWDKREGMWHLSWWKAELKNNSKYISVTWPCIYFGFLAHTHLSCVLCLTATHGRAINLHRSQCVACVFDQEPQWARHGIVSRMITEWTILTGSREYTIYFQCAFSLREVNVKIYSFLGFFWLDNFIIVLGRRYFAAR